MSNSAGDIIVRQGEVGREMYFIGEGKVEVRVYSQDLEFGSEGVSMMMRPVLNGIPSRPADKGDKGDESLPNSTSTLIHRVGSSLRPKKGRHKKKATQQVFLQHDDLNLPFT